MTVKHSSHSQSLQSKLTHLYNIHTLLNETTKNRKVQVMKLLLFFSPVMFRISRLKDSTTAPPTFTIIIKIITITTTTTIAYLQLQILNHVSRVYSVATGGGGGGGGGGCGGGGGGGVLALAVVVLAYA